ncbi:Sporulation-specific protein [Lachnellula hyalina]|uniref:Sporulation-specific protein n=1 Tax=Lachnellula hyalina TaxID=1316788 RepID=A0A8H8TXA5_9HELO|nr:Sporulation-specific protein [Lachnellula hyalina]TVY25317.1 Sporulation-specific protein [Lachnellula hyalina]
MSYQQATTHAENSFPARSAANMYTQPQLRTQRDSQGQTSSFAQGATQNESNPMAAMMNQFNGLAIQGANMASGASTMGSTQLQYYLTQDGQYLVAPAGMYSAQTMAPAQIPDTTYTGYPTTLPYYPQAPFPSYVPGYPLLSGYPSARAGYYSDRSDSLHKDVPGLENRRGSYSTNESAPSTPYYGSISQREQGTHIAAIDRSPFGSTPSPQQIPAHTDQKGLAPYKTIPINIDLDALLMQHPAIPRAVPAVFTPRENMRTLDQSLSNQMPGNRNVYIRGLHPNTDDQMLAAYAGRFGKVETSKAIIDTSTGACKGFGFAKYFTTRESELCIRGFYKMGYEVGFARESFNSRLKAEGDDNSTNLYVSNLPKNMTEAELGAVFIGYKVSSSRVLRDANNNSRGVGFARFESRDVCEDIIEQFHGVPIGEEGLLLQVRYADTPAQKDLKRITTERRQFRTSEYNVGAYGAPADMLALSPQMPTTLIPRASQITRHLPTASRATSSSSWKRENTSLLDAPYLKDIDRQVKTEDRHGSLLDAIPYFKDIDRQVKTEPETSKSKEISSTVPGPTPTVSDDGSTDEGVTVHQDAPAVAHGGSVTSPSACKP